MALPLAALVALSSIPSLIKGGIGVSQLFQSKKYADTPRPEYEIPQSIKDMLGSAQRQASAIELPGQALAEQKLAGSTSRGISAARNAADSPVALLGLTTQLAGNEQDKLKDFAIAGAEQYAANQDTLRNALGVMGEQELAKWTWDKKLPYTDAMTTASNLQESGQENIVNSLSDIAGTALTAGTNQMYLNDMAKQKELDRQAWVDSLKLQYGFGGQNKQPQTPIDQQSLNATNDSQMLTQLLDLWNKSKSTGWGGMGQKKQSLLTNPFLTFGK